MLLQGKKIEGFNVETIVIPRGEGAIVFKARALPGDAEFLALCPRPKPKVSMGKGGKKIEQDKAPTYIEAISQWGERKVAWMMIKSLEATDDLVWETVKQNDPSTWMNYRQELEDSGFSDAEQVRIINGVLAANGLDEEKVEAARQRFLASQQEELAIELSLTDELSSTLSGEPVNA